MTITLAKVFLAILPLSLAQDDTERLFWDSVRCHEEMEVRAYLEEFPKGAYVDEAIECLRSGGRDDSESGDGIQEETAEARGPFEPEMVQVDDFRIGKYEVTQGQWEAVMGNNPSHFKNGDNYPIENVSWNDVQEYIQKLNARTDGNYRLPTENEWKRACRGGGPEREYCGSDDIDAVAWYSGNSNHSTHPVGQKKPNRLGIHDMSGNVSEWTNARDGMPRVLRGGSWLNFPRNVRSANRSRYDPGYRDGLFGFRLAHD